MGLLADGIEDAGQGGHEPVIGGTVADRDAEPAGAQAREGIAPADRETGLAQAFADGGAGGGAG
jgi:hypothetical protein